VLQMVLQQGMRLVIAGLAAGVILAAALGRLVAGLLYGVDAAHVPAYAVTAVLLLASALLACLVPARRAMRVDPMIALRQE